MAKSTKRTRKTGDGPIIVKKYANRRLYNTATSSYVTLDHLSQMVKEGKDFVVQDAKSGEDITRSVLTQIIFEEESKGQNLLPIRFLRQLIRFYGDSLQSFVPSYLEMSMENFSREQEKMREKLANTFGTPLSLRDVDEQIRQAVAQNIAMFERAVRMFTPFSGRGAKEGETPEKTEMAGPAAAETAKADEIADLKKQLADIQQKLNRMSKES